MRLTFLDPDLSDLVDPSTDQIREALLNLPQAEDPRAVLEDPGGKNYMQLAIEEDQDALICQVEYREYFSDLTSAQEDSQPRDLIPDPYLIFSAAEIRRKLGVEGHVHAFCADVELPVAVELFQSYSSGDGNWRTKVAWEEDSELTKLNPPPRLEDPEIRVAVDVPVEVIEDPVNDSLFYSLVRELSLEDGDSKGEIRRKLVDRARKWTSLQGSPEPAIRKQAESNLRKLLLFKRILNESHSLAKEGRSFPLLNELDLTQALNELDLFIVDGPE